MADFYIRSAKALDRVLRDECSVKAAAAPHPDSGRALAILINALAYRSALMHALEESKVLKLEERTFTLSPPKPPAGGASHGQAKPKRNGKGKAAPPKSPAKSGKSDYPSKEALLLVLCHDLLFQARGIQASKTWPPKLALERYRAALHSALVKLQIRQGKARLADLRTGALYHEMTARMPRWIRINALRATRDEVFTWLAEHRYTQVAEHELQGVKEFAESQHVEGLLAFHPKATSALLGSEVYRDNWVVMQDLASCFPAYILDPPGSGHVVDATSAPGNKTSHLAAIMFSKRAAPLVQNDEEGRGRIDAFERDAVRYKTLVKRLGAVGALAGKATTGGNVIAQRKDFLATSPADLPNVTHMLLDPSCSGSGIVNRLDFLKEDDDVEDDTHDDPASTSDTNESSSTTTLKLAKRLHQLSEFQLLMLRHAFQFPALRKLVYSTCSVHAAENEAVVLRALETDEAKRGAWTLAPRAEVIPTWPVRGDREACKGRDDVAESVIRCIPGGAGEGDKPHVESCNGFFVACFVRRIDGEERAEEEGVAARKRPLGNSDDEEGEEEEVKLKSNSKAAANRKKKLQKRRKKQRLQQSAG